MCVSEAIDDSLQGSLFIWNTLGFLNFLSLAEVSSLEIKHPCLVPMSIWTSGWNLALTRVQVSVNGSQASDSMTSRSAQGKSEMCISEPQKLKSLLVYEENSRNPSRGREKIWILQMDQDKECVFWAILGGIRERLLSGQEKDAHDEKPCYQAANTINDYIELIRWQ